MAEKKAPARKKATKKKEVDPKTQIEERIKGLTDDWCKQREGISCYPLLISSESIDNHLVNKVYEELRQEYGSENDRLDVIVHSGGGDIDAAYNLSKLFRRYGKEHLEFVVPRWAKSAATMLVCSGDKILMTPVAELGPLDPQITEMNVLEGRLEQFSPLHIDATMSLIRNEYNDGNDKFAEALLQRLQFPLTLGKYSSSLNIGREYIRKLLSTRMLVEKSKEDVEDIAAQMTTGFADHGYCINVDEAQALGLIAEEQTEEQIDITWELFKALDEKERIIRQEKAKEMEERLKELPKEILDSLPELIDRKEKDVKEI